MIASRIRRAYILNAHSIQELLTSPCLRSLAQLRATTIFNIYYLGIVFAKNQKYIFRKGLHNVSTFMTLGLFCFNFTIFQYTCHVGAT